MSRYAKESGGGGFKPPMGIHNVVCCQLVDLGTQEKEWQGKVIGKSPMINIGFEFVDITNEADGETYHPLWGIKETNSLGKKANMRKLLEGWRGKAFTEDELKGFDLEKLLGLSCQLVVQPNTKGNPKVVAITKAPAKFGGNRDLHSFWFDEGFDGTLPDWIPEWMQEIIQQSDEFLGLHDQEIYEPDEPVEEEPADDDPIPF